MNSFRNSVQLMGRAGQDPEVKTFDADRKMARFSLATEEFYTNTKGEKVTETHWHNIVAWGKQAEKVEELIAKGTEMLLEGKLVSRSYIDKSGVKKYMTEVDIRDVVAIARKPQPAQA